MWVKIPTSCFVNIFVIINHIKRLKFSTFTHLIFKSLLTFHFSGSNIPSFKFYFLLALLKKFISYNWLTIKIINSKINIFGNWNFSWNHCKFIWLAKLPSRRPSNESCKPTYYFWRLYFKYKCLKRSNRTFKNKMFYYTC